MLLKKSASGASWRVWDTSPSCSATSTVHDVVIDLITGLNDPFMTFLC